MLAAVLSVLAQAAERCGRLAESARLLAAVDALRRQFAVEQPGLEEQHPAAVAQVCAALSETAFAAEWAKGEALSPEAAIEFGLAVAAELSGKPGSPPEPRTASQPT